MRCLDGRATLPLNTARRCIRLRTKLHAADKLGGDDATLAHSERNSAYVPYWHSDVSGGGSLRSSRSWMFDVERRSPVSFGGVEGDPY
jgi:hypothetical protein